MTTPPTDILSLHVLVSADTDEGKKARAAAFFGAFAIGNQLLDVQKDLIAALYDNLAVDPPAPVWDLFAKDGDVSPALTAFLVPRECPTTGSIRLSVISAPQPITKDVLQDRHYPSILGTSGLSSCALFEGLRPSAFDSGDITFDRFDFAVGEDPGANSNHLRLVHLPLTPTERLALLTYLGQETFTLATTPGILRSIGADNSNHAWNRRSTRSASRVFPLFLPLMWPLPLGHNLSILGDIVCRPTPNAFREAVASGGAINDLDWLPANPVFAAWLTGVHLYPESFRPSATSEFILSEATDLPSYEAAVRSARLIAGASLASTGKTKLFAHLMGNTQVLVDPVFPLPECVPDDGSLDEHPLLVGFPPMEPPFPLTPPTAPTPIGMPTAPTPIFAPGTNPMPPPGPTTAPIPMAVAATPSTTGPAPIPPSGAPFANSITPTPPASSLFAQVMSSTSSTTTPVVNPTKLSLAVLHWSTIGVCSFDGRTVSLPPELAPYAFPATSPPIPFTLTAATTTPSPPLDSHLLLCPLHPMMQSCLQDDARSASKRMQERFENSRNSLQSNIVSSQLLACVASGSSFFSTSLWAKIIKGQVTASPLSGDPHEAFSLIDAVLVNPAFSLHPKHHTPVLPSGGFASFSDVTSFLHSCKWFVMVCFQDHLYRHTILFRGIEYVESLLDSLHFPAKWSSQSFRAPMATYAILEAIFNLFSLLGSLASNANTSTLTPVVIPATAPPTGSYLIPAKVADATLAIDVDVSLAGWRRDCQLNLHSLTASSTRMQSYLQTDTANVLHYLFKPPTGFALPPTSDKAGAPPSKKPRRDKDRGELKEKPKKPAPGTHILEPASSSISVAQLQQDLTQGKIMPPHLKKMDKIRNATGVDLCFPYLLGLECSERGCGYHLSAAPPRPNAWHQSL